jgi:outer membrane protein insertion porin family
LAGVSILALLAGTPVGFGGGAAHAQSVAAEPSDFDGRPVRDIVLSKPVGSGAERTYESLEADTEQLARMQLRLERGRPYRAETVTGDIQRLNRLGRFRLIETRVQRVDDGSVIVYYDLIPQPIVRDVQAVGNTKFADRRILEQVEVVLGTPVDRLTLDRAARGIEAMYRKKGYYLVQVTWDEKELEEQGIVLFRIREGERVRIAEIRYEGNLSFSPDELGVVVKTRPSFPILKTGEINDEQISADTVAVADYYKNFGYLDVEVAPSIRLAPNGREAIVTFVISEGQLYTLRDVRVIYPELARNFESETEARAEAKPGEFVIQDPFRSRGWLVGSTGFFDASQIVGLMSSKPGDAYSIKKINESIEAIRTAYGEMGFINARVQNFGPRSPDSPEVDLLITITEGSRYYTGIVEIQNNDLTKQNVIRKEVQLKPGRPLSTSNLEESEKLLSFLNIFETGSIKATPQRPDPEDPRSRDVLVEVGETNTGAIAFGVVAGSDNGVQGSISLTQRNFDIADTPETAGEFFSGRAFRGAGQTFRIEALPGNEVQTYSVSISDPSLLDSDYSTSVSAYYRDRQFSEYDEERLGSRLGFGRRFGTRWTGNLTARYEIVELSDIEPDAPTDIYEFEDQNTITGLAFQLTRSTYDNIFRPSKGTRVVLSAEQIGVLGGDYTFTKLGADYTTFFKFREDALGRKSVISINVAANYIPGDKDDVPVYERYYLGGRSFRGFDFRTVSPRGVRNDNGEPSDDPIGGLWSFFAGIEAKQPLFGDTFSIVGFIDTGTVLEEPGLEDYRVAVGLGLRLYIPQISPFDLAFDFGFPIISEDTDEERFFSFSIDLPF